MRKLFVAIVLLVLVVIFARAIFSGTGQVNIQNKYIAVIKIQGPLYSTSIDSLTGQTSGADDIMRQLIAAREDDSVAAVLLRIDTPGGSVTAAEEITVEIDRLKQKGKVVVTSMGDVAASAGYWLATCTDYIYANPSTLTGSIGVYVPYTNLEELYKKIGVRQDRIKSGPYKDMMSTDRPMTTEERQILQNMVNDMYVAFVKQVSKGRNLPEDKVRQLADGRVYTGKQAKELGLIDELGNYYDALNGTAKRAGIEGEPLVKEYKEPFPWYSMLKMNFLGTMADFLNNYQPKEVIEQKGFY